MVSDANITPMASHVNIARLWVLAFDAMILTSPGPEVGSQLRARCWANGYQPQMVRGMPEKLDPPRDFGTNPTSKCSKCARPLQFEASSDWHIKTESSSPVDIHSPICVSQNLIINRWSSWSNTIICLDLFPYPSPKLRWCKLQDATGHWITWTHETHETCPSNRFAQTSPQVRSKRNIFGPTEFIFPSDPCSKIWAPCRSPWVSRPIFPMLHGNRRPSEPPFRTTWDWLWLTMADYMDANGRPISRYIALGWDGFGGWGWLQVMGVWLQATSEVMGFWNAKFQTEKNGCSQNMFI